MKTVNHKSPASKSPSPEQSARATILDAAERLFGEHGFDGVSMRELTKAAGVNLASVNYHFGSKEKLFTEVVTRYIRPVNAKRLEMLEAVLARSGEEPPPLAEILDAFARPLIDACANARNREQLQRLIVRVFMEADGEAMPIFEQELLPLARQFGMTIARSRPELPMKCVAMGLFFFVGAMINLVMSMRRLKKLESVIGEIPQCGEMLDMLIGSGVAIFDALGEKQKLEDK
jgi:AcrR family transcriptional regulator